MRQLLITKLDKINIFEQFIIIYIYINLKYTIYITDI
jgi:hypothetical protein